MPKSLFDIEIYNEDEFRKEHKEIAERIEELFTKIGIDRKLFEFSQFLMSGRDGDVAYGHVSNEDITLCFTITALENGETEIHLDCMSQD